MQTLAQAILRSHRFVRQTGNGHFALIVVGVEPDSQKTLLSPNLEQLPREFAEAAFAGLSEELGEFPCRVELLDGAYHEMDSRALDFEYAGRRLAREILEAPRATLPDPLPPARDWPGLWNDLQARCQAELKTRLAPLGFSPDGEGFVRRSGPILQRVMLHGNAPRLPSAIDLRMELQLPGSGRQLGHLRLSRQGDRKWLLEDPQVFDKLFATLTPEWLLDGGDPSKLVENRPPGIFWFSSAVEAPLLALAGHQSEALSLSREAVQQLKGKLGRQAELRELEALIDRLSPNP